MCMNVRPFYWECPTDLDPIPAKRIDEIDGVEPRLIEIDGHTASIGHHHGNRGIRLTQRATNQIPRPPETAIAASIVISTAFSDVWQIAGLSRGAQQPI